MICGGIFCVLDPESNGKHVRNKINGRALTASHLAPKILVGIMLWWSLMIFICLFALFALLLETEEKFEDKCSWDLSNLHRLHCSVGEFKWVLYRSIHIWCNCIATKGWARIGLWQLLSTQSRMSFVLAGAFCSALFVILAGMLHAACCQGSNWVSPEGWGHGLKWRSGIFRHSDVHFWIHCRTLLCRMMMTPDSAWRQQRAHVRGWDQTSTS